MSGAVGSRFADKQSCNRRGRRTQIRAVQAWLSLQHTHYFVVVALQTIAPFLSSFELGRHMYTRDGAYHIPYMYVVHVFQFLSTYDNMSLRHGL